MTEQEAMQILADMGLHEGGMDNWVPDNAWYRFANVVEAAARADEREECAELMFRLDLYGEEGKAAEAIRARGTT
jgi:hypothetical protein